MPALLLEHRRSSVAWSAMHGLAMPLIDGPLRGFDRARTEAIGRRLLDMVEHGL